MRDEHTSLVCTIAGRSVAELPFGMDEEHPDCVALKLIIANRIAALNAVGVTKFYSNCEYGVGLFAAETVIVLRNTFDIRLNVVMPTEQQANLYSREVRERFFTLHEKADSVEILNAREYKSCYREADMYMVDYSDVLLTDDSDSFIAHYAAKQGLRIELLGRQMLGV